MDEGVVKCEESFKIASGGIGGFAAGHIHADPLDGGDVLAQGDPRRRFVGPGGLELFFVEGADIVRRFFDGGDEFRIGSGEGLVDFFGTDLQIGDGAAVASPIPAGGVNIADAGYDLIPV